MILISKSTDTLVNTICQIHKYVESYLGQLRIGLSKLNFHQFIEDSTAFVAKKLKVIITALVCCFLFGCSLTSARNQIQMAPARLNN